MPNLAISADKLIKAFNQEFSNTEDDIGASKIKLNNVVSKLGFFYEKIRNLVDYREENLLKKHAILRFLKRNVFLSDNFGMGFNINKEARFLIHELIRAKYLPNNAISEDKVKQVAVIINKYLRLREKYLKISHKGEKNAKKITNWLFGLAACEIERQLEPAVLDRALAGCMYEVMKKQVVINNKKISDYDKELLLYIALHRALLKYDYDLISFLIFRLYWPDWPNKEASDELIENVASKLDSFISFTNKRINHSLSQKLLRISSRYSVFFLVLKEVLVENKDKIDDLLSNTKFLEEEVAKVCEKKYKTARLRLYRSAINSIVYIFITKMGLALLLELPYDIYILGSFHYVSLIINIVFPPFLMLVVVSLIRVPGEKNTALIIQGIKALLFNNDVGKQVKIKSSVKRSFLISNLFVIFYLLMFMLSFGAIGYVLKMLNFSIFSMILFFFFLCLISFFGVRIRGYAKEMVVLRKKDNLISSLVDFFTLPFLRVGRWLSFNLSKINIFVFLLDFLIEAPFQLFIEIMEEWFSFIKEKKDEIY